MIFTDRNHLDENNKEIKPNEEWFKKAEAAKETILKDKENHIVQEDVYRNLDVKISLEKLFEYKCAYCENSLEETGWNVEHYRPKGRVFERKDHPGYYWLAYEWDNLFPSCTPCNQKRKDLPLWEDHTWGKTEGKADHFPLGDEKRRVMNPDEDLLTEDPLLINPCVDDPEKYLTNDVLGNIVALKSDDKSNLTIKYFNLNRKRLKRKRKIIVEAAIEFVKLIEEKKKDNDMVFQQIESLFESQCLSSGSIFSACARSVKKFPSNFGIIFI